MLAWKSLSYASRAVLQMQMFQACRDRHQSIQLLSCHAGHLYLVSPKPLLQVCVQDKQLPDTHHWLEHVSYRWVFRTAVITLGHADWEHSYSCVNASFLQLCTVNPDSKAPSGSSQAGPYQDLRVDLLLQMMLKLCAFILHALRFKTHGYNARHKACI